MSSGFVVCINNSGYPASLELHRIYRVVPDEDAAADGDIRVVDESGEDYLYPASHFTPIRLPAAIEKSLPKSHAGSSSPNMKTQEFMVFAQKRASELAVGASSLRNQGASGLINAARAFFKEISLSDFAAGSRDDFAIRLNAATDELRKRFPAKAQNWGAARKAINLFLRDAFYNRYLFRHYNLGPIEYWLEVPLDKDVAVNLMASCHGKTLPKWRSIKSLLREESDKYQEAAAKHAHDLGIARVHLDLLFFRQQQK